jgi:hypothetical protein
VIVFSLLSGDDIDAYAWNRTGKGIVSDVDGDRFGYSVCPSANCRTLAVGARLADGKNGEHAGSVRIYRMDDSEMNWIQIGNDIEGEAASDLSGYLVSLSADGNKVAIGSLYNDDNGESSGHVRVFALE